uniref:Uncharacterized protein n=1 Tax=Oreochromis niloticus TaxID=8128 RepID=A0A669DCS6_ORENI
CKMNSMDYGPHGTDPFPNFDLIHIAETIANNPVMTANPTKYLNHDFCAFSVCFLMMLTLACFLISFCDRFSDDFRTRFSSFCISISNVWSFSLV